MAGAIWETPVQGDVADLVDVLLENRHPVGILHDVIVVVVPTGQRGDSTVPDTPDGQWHVLRSSGGAASGRHISEPLRLGRRLPRVRLRRQGGQPPVRRIDDYRRAPRGCRAIVEPQIVVEARCPVLSPVHVAAGVRSPRGPVQQALIIGDPLLLEVGRLFVRQKLLGRQLFRTFHRRDGAVVPDPLQIRIAPRRAGRFRRLRRSEQWRQRHDREHDEHRNDTSMNHLPSSALLARPHDGPHRNCAQGRDWLPVPDRRV